MVAGGTTGQAEKPQPQVISLADRPRRLSQAIESISYEVCIYIVAGTYRTVCYSERNSGV